MKNTRIWDTGSYSFVCKSYVLTPLTGVWVKHPQAWPVSVVRYVNITTGCPLHLHLQETESNKLTPFRSQGLGGVVRHARRAATDN